MTDEHMQMQAEGFVLGTLTATESAAFAKRLSLGDVEARAAFDEARRIMLALPYALPQQTPPAHLKQNILNVISAESKSGNMPKTKHAMASVRELPQRTFRQSAMRSLAWAAVFLLFAVGYGYWNQQHRIAALLEEVENLKLKLAFHVQVEKTLQKPRRLIIALNNTKAEHAGTGAALVDGEQGRGYFMTDKLPALAADQDYQLWYIGNAGPVAAGVFQVDASGFGIIDMSNLPQDASEISAFAVTIEPKGGSAKPTLDQMVLLGKVG